MKTFIMIVSVSILIGTTSWALAYEPPVCDGEITYDTGSIFCQKKQWILPTPFEVESECAFSALSSMDGTKVCPSKWGNALFRHHYRVTQEVNQGKYGSEIQTFSVKDLGLRWTWDPTVLFVLILLVVIQIGAIYNREIRFHYIFNRGIRFHYILKGCSAFVYWMIIASIVVEFDITLATISVFLASLLAIHNGARHIYYKPKKLEK